MTFFLRKLRVNVVSSFVGSPTKATLFFLAYSKISLFLILSIGLKILLFNDRIPLIELKLEAFKIFIKIVSI